MSDIRANTISNVAGTGPIDLHKQSAAKAWVNFNGTGTVAIRDSFNVSSLTDNGTGDYTVSLSNSMADANYTHGGMAGMDISSLLNVSQNRNTYPPTASTSRYEITYVNLTKYDSFFVGMQLFGDLA